MKKVLSVLAGAVLLFGSAGVALAYVPVDYTFSLIDSSLGPISTTFAAPSYPDTGDVLGTDPTTGQLAFLQIGPGLVNTGSGLQVSSIVADKVIIPDGDPLGYWFTNVLPFSYASTSTVNTLSSTVSSLSSSLSSLSTNVAILSENSGLTLSGIKTFMLDQATTSQLVATSTFNGFMSGAMVIKLAALSTTTPRSMATTTRSIVTGTGATGFQISSSRDAEVRYSTTIVTTSSIAGSQNGTVVLEIAPTNSATATDWSEIGRCTNGTSYTLAIAIQGVSTQACQITGYVPAGYFAKIRSINNAGTPTFSYNSGQEVLQ